MNNVIIITTLDGMWYQMVNHAFEFVYLIRPYNMINSKYYIYIYYLTYSFNLI